MRTSSTLLAVLLIANLAASALHFADNMLRFDEYPEPKWITGPHVVDALWLMMTPLLAVGWWFRCREKKWAAVGVLWLYGFASIFVLGHYFYASPRELAFRIHFFIGAEAVAAVLLILLAPFAIPQRPLRESCDAPLSDPGNPLETHRGSRPSLVVRGASTAGRGERPSDRTT